MKFTNETIITAEMLNTEEITAVRNEMDNWVTVLINLVLDVHTIKNNMVGKTIEEIENEIDNLSDKVLKLGWEM
ncbi:MAG: hypothetical protein IKB70_08335 [Bacilli bacterium]|nr:hypothetical protein [Bacilli bacterium]